MKITVKKALELNQLCSNLNLKDNDFRMIYALAKNVSNLKSIIEKYEEKHVEKQLELAEEKDGVICKQENGDFKFSKAGCKHLNKWRAGYLPTEIDFEPYMLPVYKGLFKLNGGILSELDILLPDDIDKQMLKFSEENND